MPPACHSVFFFQAKDGIRDLTVTGVQTCALPICEEAGGEARPGNRREMGWADDSSGQLGDRRYPEFFFCAYRGPARTAQPTGKASGHGRKSRSAAPYAEP